MRLRREPIVFLAALAFLGLIAWRKLRPEEEPRGSRSGGDSLELVDHAAPDLALVLPPAPDAERSGAAAGLPDGARALVGGRELFAPPRDTNPLPPLELEPPPLAALPALLPPPVPGPAPALYGRFLRADATPVEVLGLFAEPGEELAGAEGFDFDEDGPAGAASISSGSGGLDGLAADGGGADGLVEGLEDGLAARTARIESYKRLHDWVQLGQVEYLFGSIRNPDRYALDRPERRDEPIELLQLDPTTGQERFPGQGAIRFERDRVSAWNFADTVANRLEQRFRDIEGRVTPGSFGELLAFADECVRVHREAPRALEIAASVYRLLADFEANDPRPRLGIARVHEAAFEFDRAFAEYEALLERFPHRADVLVRLGELEDRFLLHAAAEERFREALRVERSSWQAHWALGRFLADRGRWPEAREHLAAAARFAPEDPQRLHVRVEIRADLGAAHLALGELDQAADVLDTALRADPLHERTLAGLVVLEALRSLEAGEPAGGGTAAGTGAVEPGADEPGAVAAASDLEGVGFDLLLAQGVAQLWAGEHLEALELLESAAAADPLRAGVAWRALSWLAEVTGYPERAAAYVDRAVENDPTDVWALYQRGRLLEAGDDDEGARAAWLDALEREIELVDALVALGRSLHERGRFDEAQRYLERALELEPGRARVLLLRGLNELELGDLRGARASFEAALQSRPAADEEAGARAGLAWCTYRLGDPDEAINLLARLDDDRRELPPEDPWRVWATGQIERIQDHLQKAAWTDRFERKTLKNGWQADERAGPRVALDAGVMTLSGTFEGNGRVQVCQLRPTSQFVSIEADVWVSADSAARAGLFVAREKPRGRETELISEAAVLRHRDGRAQVRFLERSESEPDLRDLTVPFPADTWVRLRIERTGDSSDSRVSLYIDGIPVTQEEPMRDLGRANTPLLIGFFAEGENGRRLDMRMDNVEIVFRQGS